MSRARKYQYNGEMLTIVEIAAISGTSESLIRHRVSVGWTAQNAADTPKLRSKHGKRTGAASCGATTWKACFTCHFPDCIAGQFTTFPDDPIRTDPYFVCWRSGQRV